MHHQPESCYLKDENYPSVMHFLKMLPKEFENFFNVVIRYHSISIKDILHLIIIIITIKKRRFLFLLFFLNKRRLSKVLSTKKWKYQINKYSRTTHIFKIGMFFNTLNAFIYFFNWTQFWLGFNKRYKGCFKNIQTF